MTSMVRHCDQLVALFDRGGVHTSRKRWRCEAALDDAFDENDPVGYERRPDDPVYVRAVDCERVIEANRNYIADEFQQGWQGFSESRLCLPCGVANFALR